MTKLSTRAEILRAYKGSPALRTLSQRQLQIFEALVLGKRNKEIAAELNLSVRTVECLASTVLGKMGEKNRFRLKALALKTLPLSPHEYRIIRNLLTGLNNKQIAFELGLTAKALSSGFRLIYEKANVTSLTQLVMWCHRRPEDLELWPTNQK